VATNYYGQPSPVSVGFAQSITSHSRILNQEQVAVRNVYILPQIYLLSLLTFLTVPLVSLPALFPRNAMSEQPRLVTPAHLGFLAIYNPSLGTTDETLENQIVYYSSPESRGDRSRQKGLSDAKAIQDVIREQNNERLRQIGLAQGMVEFGRSFSDGQSVDTIETEKSRIVLHELEAGWWILAVSQITPRDMPMLTRVAVN
jgi:hypothetical protein